MNRTRSSVSRGASILAAAYVAIVSFSLAQTAERAVPAAKSTDSTTTYGTTTLTSHTIDAYAFTGYYANTTLASASDGSGGRYPVTGLPFVEAPVFLPSGAVIDHYELEACSGATSTMLSRLWQCTNGSCSDLFFLTVPLGNGCNRVSSPAGSVTVDNLTSSYHVEVQFAVGDGSQVIRAARFFYKLQVSPGPAVATFADVPTTSPQFKFVEALVAAGITAGCGGGNYCPASPVTRGQMAVFLASALGLHFPELIRVVSASVTHTGAR